MADVGFWESAFLWRDALVVASLAAALLGYLGLYVVLTQSAFVSAAITQLAGLGVVVALWLDALGWHVVDPMVAGVVLAVAGASLRALPLAAGPVPVDGWLATAMVGASGLTLVIARFLPTDYAHVQAALFGDAVVASRGELAWLLVVAAGVVLTHRRFGDRILLVVSDRDEARIAGLPVTRLAALLWLSIGVTLAVATRAIGALPAWGFSVLPAMIALIATRGLARARLVAVAVALAAAASGYVLSFERDLPTGPAMVAVLLAALAVTGAVRAITSRLRRAPAANGVTG